MQINDYYNKIKNIIDKVENGQKAGSLHNAENYQHGGAQSDALRDSYNTNKAKIIKLLVLYYISANLPEISSQGFDIITGISLAPIIPENLDETIILLKKTVFNELKTYLIKYDFAKPGKILNKLPSFDNFIKKLGLSEKFGDFITQMPDVSPNATMNLLQNLKKVILTDSGLLYQITLSAAEISNISAAFMRLISADKITFASLGLFNTGLIYFNKVKNLSDQQVDYDDTELLEKYEYLNDPAMIVKIYNQIYIETMWQQYSEYKKKKRESEIMAKIIDWLQPQLIAFSFMSENVSSSDELSSGSDSDTDNNMSPNFNVTLSSPSLSQNARSPRFPRSIKTKQFRDNLLAFLEQNSLPKKIVESKSFIPDFIQALKNADISNAALTNLFFINLSNKLSDDNSVTDIIDDIVDDESNTSNITQNNKPIWFVEAVIDPSRINITYIDKFKAFLIEQFKIINKKTEAEINDDIDDGVHDGVVNDTAFFDNFTFYITIIIKNYLLFGKLITKYKYSVFLYLDNKYIFILDSNKAEFKYMYEPEDIYFLRKNGRNLVYLHEDPNYFIDYYTYASPISSFLEPLLTSQYNYLREYELHGAKLFKRVLIEDNDPDYITYDNFKVYYKKANIAYFMFITQTFNHFRQNNKHNKYLKSSSIKKICSNESIYSLIINTIVRYYIGTSVKKTEVFKSPLSLQEFILQENFPLTFNGKTILDEIDDGISSDFLKDLIIKYDISKDYYKLSPRLILSSYLYNYSFLPNENRTAKLILHEIIIKLLHDVNNMKGGGIDDAIDGENVGAIDGAIDGENVDVGDDAIDGGNVGATDDAIDDATDDAIDGGNIVQKAGANPSAVNNNKFANETIALMLCHMYNINICINNKVFNPPVQSITWIFIKENSDGHNYESYCPSAYYTNLYNNTMENYLELKKLYESIIQPSDRVNYIYKNKLYSVLSKNLIASFNKLPIKEIDEDNIIIEQLLLMKKILKLLRIHHMIFIDNEMSILSSMELIIIKLANCYYDYEPSIIIYVKKLLIDYILLSIYLDKLRGAPSASWNYTELNKLPLLSIIALLLSHNENNKIPNLALLRLKHYLKVGIDGTKELIPNALPKFVHSGLPALARIIPSFTIKGASINGGYREVIYNFLNKPENRYYIDKSNILTDFDYISIDGTKSTHSELILQIATELLYNTLYPVDFKRYPLDYIYSWHKKTYLELYVGIDQELYDALVLAEYYIIQKIIKKAKMTIFSEELGDFINDYKEIVSVMHDCFESLAKLNKMLNPTTVNIYKYIVAKL